MDKKSNVINMFSRKSKSDDIGEESTNAVDFTDEEIKTFLKVCQKIHSSSSELGTFSVTLTETEFKFENKFYEIEDEDMEEGDPNQLIRSPSGVLRGVVSNFTSFIKNDDPNNPKLITAFKEAVDYITI